MIYRLLITIENYAILNTLQMDHNMVKGRVVYGPG